MKYKGIIFDFDLTLINRDIAEPFRKKNNWRAVFGLIPQFTLYSGLGEVFEYIKNSHVQICIVSNCSTALIKSTCKHFGIPHQHILSGYDKVGNMNKALQLMNLQPNEVISFGDGVGDMEASNTNDILFIPCCWDNKELINIHNHIINPIQIVDIIKG